MTNTQPLKPLPETDAKAVAGLREQIKPELQTAFDEQCNAMHVVASRDGIPTFLAPLMSRHSKAIKLMLLESGVKDAAQKAEELLGIYVKLGTPTEREIVPESPKNGTGKY